MSAMYLYATIVLQVVIKEQVILYSLRLNTSFTETISKFLSIAFSGHISHDIHGAVAIIIWSNAYSS